MAPFLTHRGFQGTQLRAPMGGGGGPNTGMFAFGQTDINGPGNLLSVVNRVSNTGVIAGDAGTVATARSDLGGCGYGGDKGGLAFGTTVLFVILVNPPTVTNEVNLISNTGVVASGSTSTGTARSGTAGLSFGTNRNSGIFYTGSDGSFATVVFSNILSNTGVLANDVSSPFWRGDCAGVTYGGDKGIFGYGGNASFANVNSLNYVSNTGVVANTVAGVGSARNGLTGVPFGGDRSMFIYFFGPSSGIANLVSNTGVVSSDTAVAGDQQGNSGGVGFGGNQGIVAYGFRTIIPGNPNVYNTISSTGVVSGDMTGVGTRRYFSAGAPFGT